MALRGYYSLYQVASNRRRRVCALLAPLCALIVAALQPLRLAAAMQCVPGIGDGVEIGGFNGSKKRLLRVFGVCQMRFFVRRGWRKGGKYAAMHACRLALLMRFDYGGGWLPPSERYITTLPVCLIKRDRFFCGWDMVIRYVS